MWYPFNRQCSAYANLDDAREHDKALLLVLVCKFLPIASFLLASPGNHLGACNNDEQQYAQVLGYQTDANPCDNFPQVIRARHPTEAEALWDCSDCSAFRTQIGEYNMRVRIEQLANNEQCQPGGSNRNALSVQLSAGWQYGVYGEGEVSCSNMTRGNVLINMQIAYIDIDRRSLFSVVCE